jgi:hypothetical protein
VGVEAFAGAVGEHALGGEVEQGGADASGVGAVLFGHGCLRGEPGAGWEFAAGEAGADSSVTHP